jgi:Ca2+-binding EF-hand superfamily protein
MWLFAQMKQPTRVVPPISGNPTKQTGLESAELIRQLDTDHDGFISLKEWDGFFAGHDENGDGKLSPEEIQSTFTQSKSEDAPGPDYGRVAAFERLDKNRNDAIDKEEWPGNSKDFNYLDVNRNGSLSREEFLAKSGRWWNEPFENLDFNGDKVIARSEWLDSDASFERLDRDHNGGIDRREFYNPQ